MTAPSRTAPVPSVPAPAVPAPAAAPAAAPAPAPASARVAAPAAVPALVTTAPAAAPRAALAARSASVEPTVPAGSTSRLPVSTLLALARRGLVEACGAATAGERYAAAHLAALRVAAAVLACRARPVSTPAGGRRSRPTSAWVLLATVAPELAEWAAFFAAGAGKRAAAEAGLPSAVTPREADDLVRDVEAFLVMVEGSLGAPGSQLLLASG